MKTESGIVQDLRDIQVLAKISKPYNFDAFICTQIQIIMSRSLELDVSIEDVADVGKDSAHRAVEEIQIEIVNF